MILNVFGWPISGDDVIGIVMAVLAAIYLVAVLILPEKLG